jgi:recombination associated protein RdgC
MWFKQAKLFQLSDSFRCSIDSLIQKLDLLAFQPCLPSMPKSIGWVSPVDQDKAPLAQAVNGCMMICLQIEEKILPAIVINQELQNKVKQIETLEVRKVYQREKLALKDDIIASLLPRAFSKLTRIYGYIDTRNHWLVLGNNNEKKTELFISLFNKSLGEKAQSLEIKNPTLIMTQWLLPQNPASTFSIEKSCVLQDPNQEKRVIRCQQQDLFSNSIQLLIKDGCEVKQIALSWQEHVNFVLSSDLSLQSIHFQDKVLAHVGEMEPESKLQQFHADFLIMSELFASLFKELLNQFIAIPNNVIPIIKTA